MKLDAGLLLGLIGIGGIIGAAFTFFNNKKIVESFATPGNHPPGTIITPSQNEFPPERGKEDHAPYGYIEPSTFVPDHLLDSTFDTDDPPTIRDPRQVQAEALEQEWRRGQLEHFKSVTYPPLTEAEIARELQRHPVGWEAKPGWTIRSSYPGFIRLPNGLLKWDGRTIPDFLRGIYEEGMRCTSGAQSTSQSPEDLVYCASRREKLRYIMEQLRNRPWYPGYDLTNDPNLALRPGTPQWAAMSRQLSGQSIQQQMASCNGDQECINALMQHQRFGVQTVTPFMSKTMSTFRNMNDINYMFGRPSVMITAKEELYRITNPAAYSNTRREQSALYKQIEDERRSAISGNLDPGEAELIARKEAERKARREAIEQRRTTDRVRSRVEAQAELQKWVNMINFDDDDDDNYYYLSPSILFSDELEVYYVGSGSSIDRKRRLG